MKVTRDIISIAQSMRLSMLSPFISFKFCLENKALYSSVFKDHGSGFQAQFERWPGYSGVIRVAGSEPRSSFLYLHLMQGAEILLSLGRDGNTSPREMAFKSS